MFQVDNMFKLKLISEGKDTQINLIINSVYNKYINQNFMKIVKLIFDKYE